MKKKSNESQDLCYSIMNNSELIKYANEGHVEAMYYLGCHYRVADFIKEAIVWLTKASDKGHIAATKELAICYQNSDEKKYQEYLVKAANLLDEREYGIQVHDTIDDAFKILEGRGNFDEDMIILRDDLFEHVVFSRAIQTIADRECGTIDKKECNKNLGKGSTINNYLLDFPFLLYSKNGKLYTLKRDSSNVWSNRQWKIYYELKALYDFSSIVDRAEAYIKNAKKHAYDGYDDLWDYIDHSDIY